MERLTGLDADGHIISTEEESLIATKGKVSESEMKNIMTHLTERLYEYEAKEADSKCIECEIRKCLDEIYNESTILPENFGEEIVAEIKDRFIEDRFKITRQTVLEEMLWCYMCKMQ